MNILNQDKINDLARDIGDENVPVLLDIFLGELSSYIETLTSSDDAKAMINLAEISHALKSSAASFGAEKLCAYAVEVDNKVKLNQQIDADIDLMAMVELLQETRVKYLGLVSQ
ncbi:Hpt domain-containing protein [Vibrio clamense]|uniref:quorum-sensing phosphorelay protein LuxU n=1 Tax=Vibrio clamense TaxID=2910254 RepID=UPI003D1F472F